MSAWAINTKYVELRELQKQSFLALGTTGSFSVESDLDDISIHKDNRFLFLKDQKKELFFTNQGLITKVADINVIKPGLDEILNAQKKNRPVPKDRYRHTYEYSIDKILTENNNLNDLKYSLKSVDNFGKPQVHFQQQIRQLIETDFDTIVNGYIYTSRTVFGKLINSLPRQNKLEFMLQAMEKYKTIDFIKIPLLDGIDFLNEYIKKRILSRGKLLVATDNLISNSLNNLIDKDEVGFINEETGNEKNIKSQASIFRRLNELEGRTDFLNLIKDTISKNEDLEVHFNKVFSRETWPIDLRM